MRLVTDLELALRFQIDVAELHTLRRRHHWPYVRMGRNNIRFTEAQVQQIIAQHTETPAVPAAAGDGLLGQTRRSAARTRRR